MAVRNLSFSQSGNFWETEPIVSVGGDMRIRLHKKSLYPVDVMVSIDGVEEYLKHDDFGMDEYKCEITLEGVMSAQRIKLRSRSEFTLVKILEE